MTVRRSTEIARQPKDGYSRCTRKPRKPSPASLLPVAALALLAVVTFYAAIATGLLYEPLYGAGLLLVWYGLCLSAVGVYERGRFMARHASAFDHDKSRCVRRNELGEPVGAEYRTLTALFDEYEQNGIELWPVEVSNATEGFGYRSVVTFAADNRRGANQVRYLCTLGARTSAIRLGLSGYWDAYKYRQVRV